MYGIFILLSLLNDIKPKKKEDVKYFGGCLVFGFRLKEGVHPGCGH
jgi:hypothetical protein